MGKITVVGIGPGSLEDMTPRAKRAIEEAAVVAGYTTYIRLIEGLIDEREVIGTGMMQEIDRCRMAVETAAKGRDTVVVSSGDSGVYGMAGLVLELLLQREAGDRPEFGGVIAGISAVNAAASILGAPLMHDFAVISLSDLLTPWELIKKRAAAAAEADFVVALYNPKSKKRVQNIEEITECYNTSGDFDFLVKVYAHDMKAYQQFMLNTLGRMECIGSLHSVFVIGEIKNTHAVPVVMK